MEELMPNTLTDVTNISKNKRFKRFGEKCNDPTTSLKTHWSKVKTLVNRERLLSFLPCPFPPRAFQKVVLNVKLA